MAIDAPESFVRLGDKPGHELTYHIELITPMAGGGTKSWVPDLENPVRTQSIKGQLRFWWRTMQNFTSAEELKKREDEIWGATDTASRVRLWVELENRPEILEIERNDRGILQFSNENLPDYVLFPMVSMKEEDTKMIRQGLEFNLVVSFAEDEIAQEVENTVKLWLLFGGLGARTRRGCGSLYCKKIMDQFKNCEDIKNFIKEISPENACQFGESPWPVIANSRFAFKTAENQKNPAGEWNAYLNSYKNFRQGPGVARNQGTGSRPGRTRWPEADAIRRITGIAANNHEPKHPAGNWFPRGAYGLPIQTEFRNAEGDPKGRFMLQPEGYERWPSPVFLKVIKHDDKRVSRICLILNHAVPENLVLTSTNLNHKLSDSEFPMAFKDKKMPENAPLRSGDDPYTALIRHLHLTEVK